MNYVFLYLLRFLLINIKTHNSSEINDYLYLKPWIKINTIHKIIKLKEFLNNLENFNNEGLKQELIDLIKSKKLKVNYDSTKGTIISINDLIYENNNYYIKA